HKATRNATILNDKFKDQYDRFLKYLSQKAQHGTDDLLILIVYLLAQDRIMDAKKFFQQLNTLMNSNTGASNEYFQQLQYDYLWVYLSLCVEIQANSSAKDITLDLAGIQALLNKYRDYPVERWRKLFKDMQSYVDEIVQSCAEIDSSSAPDSQTSSSAEDAINSNSANKEDEDDDNAPEVPVM
ncbi:hypothetical protein BGX27_006950, partial [Mortierella sp. AM989]